MDASTSQSNSKYCVPAKPLSFGRQLLAIFFLMALPVFVFSQNKEADKANELYKLEQYTPASEHYEAAIAELKNKGKSARHLLNLQTKLAFCYRANNRMVAAEALYAEIVKNERAKSKTYFFYGETLMANGKYEEAKKWFSDYQILESDDEKAGLMIKACDEVRHIKPYFEFVDVQLFPHNSPADDNAAVIWEEGVVFSSDRTTGGKIKVNILEEKSGWTGRDYLDVYFSKRNEDGSFSKPKQFSSKLSELNKNTGNTSFSLDGSEVFFTRNDNVLNKQKTYNLQLFHAENDGGRWRNVKKMPFCSPNYNFMHPAISPDGKMLFFATDKGNGQGGTDIWVSIREENGKWSKPDNLGPIVNTPANEGFPFMDTYGRLYFCSKGHVGYGGFDIFFTEMTGAGVWKKPMNLGQPINSPLDDISIYVDGERKSGMFSSSRKGGDDDIFLFEVLDAAPPEIVECDSLEPIIESTTDSESNEVAKSIETESEVTNEIEETIEESEMEKPEMLVEAEKGKDTFLKDEITAVTDTIRNREAQPEKIVFEAIHVEKIDTAEVEKETFLPSEEMANESVAFEKIEATVPTLDSVIIEDSIEVVTVSEELSKESLPKAVSPLFSFQDLREKAVGGQLEEGDRFRLDNAVFDSQIWQLTPKVSQRLDELVSVLHRFPAMNIELSAHTESIGAEESNLSISQNRANTAVEYIVREGISSERLKAVGCGENMILNHCTEGVQCTANEHLFNQRLEIKILPWGQKQ